MGVGLAMWVGCGQSISTGRADAPRRSFAEWLVGTWDIASPSGGPMLTVTIDSASGRMFMGRFTHFLTGDVGFDAERFMAFVGRSQADTAAFDVIEADRGPGRGSLRLERRGDEIDVVWFSLGEEDMLSGGRRWTMQRVGGAS